MTEAIDNHTTDDDTITILSHDIPIEPLLQRDTFHQDVLTLDGGNRLRQEHLAIVLHTIIDTISQRLFTIASGLLNIKCLLLIILINLTIGRGTDKFSMTRQGYVLSPMSIDTGTKRVYLDTLVTSEYYRQVVLDEAAEVQLGTIVKLQIDIALQLNATRLPLTSGNNDSATTQFRLAACLYLAVMPFFSFTVT